MGGLPNFWLPGSNWLAWHKWKGQKEKAFLRRGYHYHAFFVDLFKLNPPKIPIPVPHQFLLCRRQVQPPVSLGNETIDS